MRSCPNFVSTAPNPGDGQRRSVHQRQLFFITYDATDWLNGQHTIFGKVIEGEDVLAKINLRDPSTRPPSR